MTMAPQKIEAALQNIQANAAMVEGATILGVHLEGPFIHKEKHGAQDPQYIQPCNYALIEPYIEEIKMITLAPEVEGAKAFIEMMRRAYPEVVLSIGHSSATYHEAMESFSWGVSHATHLFNAMNPYHHREPSIVGAVFESDVTCDMIADGIHTHESTLRLVQQIKRERLLLITDAMRAGCMKQGSYELGGQRVEVKGKRATLEDGTLAGSVLQMNQALALMVSKQIMTLPEAVDAATKYPAEKLGIQKGRLKEGYDADIVIFDEDFSIISTIVHGEQKYQRK
jgi:N-acetylglucosamine-6-phosphate deacetylase